MPKIDPKTLSRMAKQPNLTAQERAFLAANGSALAGAPKKARPKLEPSNMITIGVLGGAYKGGRRSLAVTLTHTRDTSAPGEKAICGQPNIADPYSSDAHEKSQPPTCPRCHAKDPRFNGGR